MSSSAIHHYDLLLGEELESTQALLAKGIGSRGLVFKERAICDTLRPFFIERERYEDLMRAGTLVAAGLTLLVRRLIADPGLRRRLALSDAEERLLQADPREPMELMGRIDGFLGEDGVIRFIEYNPLGGGSVDCDELAEVFLDMPIMKRFSQRYPCRVAATRHRMVDALLSAQAKRGKPGPPSIGVLKQEDGDDVPNTSILSGSVLSLPETRKSLAMAQSAGCAVRTVDARRLTFDGKVLREGDFPIDTLIGANWPRFLSELGTEAPLWRAVRAGAAWILNSPVVDILRANKKVFALLADPDIEGIFPLDIRAALRRHVPWTRTVRDQRTTYRNETIDLLPFVASHRHSLVLKPADGYGGQGLVLGWLSDESTWRRGLKEAIQGSYIVQERVPTPRDRFPIAADGALLFQERFFDVNPFVWNGTEAAGCMIRLSATALMNQSAGGGSNIPMIVIEGRATA